MPRSIEEIEQDLVGMGYYIEDIRTGKCLIMFPEQYVSVSQYHEGITRYQTIYNYYRDCVNELSKLLANPQYELKLPRVPDIPDQHIMRLSDNIMYSRRARTDEYFKNRAQTQIDSILSEMRSVMTQMESLHSKELIVNPEAFMERARKLTFERYEAVFHSASERLSSNYSANE